MEGMKGSGATAAELASHMEQPVHMCSPAAVPLQHKEVTDVREPEVNQADDPDSCLQFTVTAVSGERQAPLKTEDGTDTEEPDESTARLLYVRVHTGSSLNSNNTPGSESSFEPAAAPAAEAAASTAPCADHAGHSSSPAGSMGAPVCPQHAAPCSQAPSADEAGTLSQAAAAAGPAQPPAGSWEEGCSDVPSQIHSRRDTGEQASPSDPAQQTPLAAAFSSQQQALQVPDPVLQELQGTHLAASADASGATECPTTPAADAAAATAACNTSSADAGAATDVPAELPGLVESDVAATMAAVAAVGAVAATAVTATTAPRLQESSSSNDCKTPVVLPPDAADLPVQAVLDELETLLAKSDELRSSAQFRNSRQVSGQHTSAHLSPRHSLSALERPGTGSAALSFHSSSLHSSDWDELDRGSRRRSSSQPPLGTRGGLGGDGDCPVLGGGLSLAVDGAVNSHPQPELAAAAVGSFRKTSSFGRNSEPQSSKDKLQALYARFLADGPPAGRSSPGKVGQQAQLRASIGCFGEARKTPATSPMRSSSTIPAYSRAELAHALAAGSVENRAGRRCRSLSPQKAPRRSQGLSTSNVQQQQQQQSPQEGYARRLSHSVSLCSSCGGVLHHNASMRSSTSSAATSGAGAGADAGAGTGSNAGRGPASAGVGTAGPNSQLLLPTTHICLSDLMSGAVAAQSAVAVQPAAAAHFGATCNGGGGSAGGGKLSPGVAKLSPGHLSCRVPRRAGALVPEAPEGPQAAAGSHKATRGSPHAHTAAGRSPSSPSRTGRGGSYQERFASSPTHRAAAGHTGGHPFAAAAPGAARRAAGSKASPSHTTSPVAAGAAAAAAVGHSALNLGDCVTLGSDGVGHARLSAGQLLHEAEAAAVQKEEELLGHVPQQQQAAGSEAPAAGVQAAAAAATQGGAIAHAGNDGSPQQQQQQSSSPTCTLKTVPEDGIVVGSATVQGECQGYFGNRSISGRKLVLSPATVKEPETGSTLTAATQQEVPSAAAHTAAAAAAAAQAQGAGAADRQLVPSSSSGGGGGGGSIRLSRCTSSIDRHRLTSCSSGRSHASTTSSGGSGSGAGSKAWRPGGTRTDPRDDCRKLQAYESARLRALQKQGLWSPGCSTSCLLPPEDGNSRNPEGPSSPRSRRSTAQDSVSFDPALSPQAHSNAAAAAAKDASSSDACVSSPSLRRTPGHPATVSAAAAAGAVVAAAPGSAGGSSSSSLGGDKAAATAASAPSRPKQSASRSAMSPAARRKPASPKAGTKQAAAQQAQTQQDIWESLVGSPCPPSLVPMMQRLQQHTAHSGSGHRPPFGGGGGRGTGSISTHSSLDRPQLGGAGSLTGRSRSTPCSGNSTTAQVEEAIRAAQAALLEKKRQVTQVRQAMTGNWGRHAKQHHHGATHALVQQGAHAAAAAAPEAAQEAAAAAEHEDTRGAIGDGSSTGGSTTGAAASNQQAHDAAATQSNSTEGISSGLSTTKDPSAFAAATEGMCSAAATPAHSPPSAAHVCTEPVVHASSSSSPTKADAAAAAPTAAGLKQPKPRRGSHGSTSGAAHRGPVLPPVMGSRRHRSVSPPKRRQVTALEAVLGIGPLDDDPAAEAAAWHCGPEAQRPFSAGPVLAAASHLGPSSTHHVFGSAAQVLASKELVSPGHSPLGAASRRRHSQHSSPGQRRVASLSPSRGHRHTAAGHTGRQLQGTRCSLDSLNLRHSSACGSIGSACTELKHGRRPHSAAELSEQLLALHRSRSAAAASAAGDAKRGASSYTGAAAAGAAGGGEADSPPSKLPLGVLLEAYSALKQNKNSSERSAAMATLLHRISDGGGSCAPAATSGSAEASLSGGIAKGSMDAKANAAQSQGQLAAQQQQQLLLLDATAATTEPREQKLRSSPFPGVESIRLDVLGRGLGPPDSPVSPGPQATPQLQGPAVTLGGMGWCPSSRDAGVPCSPSTILQTLKADSLSSWHRVSPERQAAHATLLATPKHKHANSYAADLAALAAACPPSSSSLQVGGQHGDRSVHSKADRHAGAAQQQQQGSSEAAAGVAGAPANGKSTEQQQQQREAAGGSSSSGHSCTPLRGARLSSGAGASAESQQDPSGRRTNAGGGSIAGQRSLGGSAPQRMVDTAMGRFVLDSSDAHNMSVAAAVSWLKAGLETPEQLQQRLAAHTAASAAASAPTSPTRPRSSSPRKHSSRPCSPFSCFKGRGRDMADSGDEEEEGVQQQERVPATAALHAAGVQATATAAGAAQRQDGTAAACGGVAFAVGVDNRLVMVLQQPGGSARRLLVTGMHLDQCLPTSSSSNSSGSVASAGGAAPKLDLMTDTGGAHTLELASVRDFAGLVVGLNALLLLLEQEGPEAAQRLESQCMKQVHWAGAVTGLC